jgi:glycosyltransferase involved in cell wall biosynthesis
MKILWLSHLVPYPPKAGVIQRSYHLIRQLGMRHEVDLLAFHQPRLMKPLVENLEKGMHDAVRELSKYCVVQGVFDIPSEKSQSSRLGLILGGVISRNGYTLKWIESEKYGEKIKSLLKEKRYDLIHLDTISFAPYMHYFDGIPLVLDHHNIESHMMFRRSQIERGVLKKMYFWFEAKKLRSAEKVVVKSVELNITCSEMDSDRLSEVVPNASLKVIPNGVDTDFYLPCRKESPRRLLFIGTMSWYPNIQAVDFIIRELAGLFAKQFPGLSIDIVGAGAPPYLLDIASQHSNVRMHGFVEDIRPYMNEALAFLCPIADGGGTKLKLLDAMSMAIPIIAHPVGCEGIDLDHNASVLLAETPEEYALAVQRLLDSPSFAYELGSAARGLALAKYSVDAIGIDLSEAYIEVVKRFRSGISRCAG